MRLRVSVLLGSVLMLAACGSSSAPPTTTAPTVVTTTTPTPGPSGSSATASVDVAPPDGSTGEYGQGKNEATSSFSPSNVTIAVGGTVTWTNHDITAHTTTNASGAWNGPLAPGASFSRAFPTAGTFDYRCTIHPSMSGSITVK
jgi:plastocyanin